MRRALFEILATVLLGASLAFFWQCVTFLARRDYVAGILILLVGLSVVHVGAELARLALAERDG